MSLLRDTDSSSMEGVRESLRTIRDQLDQQRRVASGLVCAAAIDSRCGVIEHECAQIEGFAQDMEAEADRLARWRDEEDA